MALDFPASPSVNQTYSGPGGVVWVWDGAKWVSGTGTTVYAPVTSPVFLGNPTAPNPPAGDADTSVATTSFVATAVGTALHDTGRNYIHNPLFNVAQRAVGPWTVNGYTLDRWWFHGTTDTWSVTQNGISDAGRAQIGDEETSFFFLNNFTGNAAAGAFNSVTQPIENMRRLGNKTITVSFWASSTSGTPKLGVSIDQYFGTGGSPSAQVNGTGQSVTLSVTWTRYSLTFTVPTLSGKTLGTNNDHATYLNFWFSSGATNATRAGSIGVQSGGITLWGVQLEIGSVATPLEKPDPRYDLANCQRMFCPLTPWGAVYVSATAGVVGTPIYFPVTMRATPTVIAINYTGSSNMSSPSCGAVSPSVGYITGTATAAGNVYLGGNLTASADL